VAFGAKVSQLEQDLVSKYGKSCFFVFVFFLSLEQGVISLSPSTSYLNVINVNLKFVGKIVES